MMFLRSLARLQPRRRHVSLNPLGPGTMVRPMSLNFTPSVVGGVPAVMGDFPYVGSLGDDVLNKSVVDDVPFSYLDEALYFCQTSMATWSRAGSTPVSSSDNSVGGDLAGCSPPSVAEEESRNQGIVLSEKCWISPGQPLYPLPRELSVDGKIPLVVDLLPEIPADAGTESRMFGQNCEHILFSSAGFSWR